MKLRILIISTIVAMSAMMTSCNSSCGEKENAPYQKKYTNKDFYKDGKLQADVCLAAYKDMLAYYGVPWTETLEKGIWITDFELGDFENVGMAGIFWVNDSAYRYFGHEIYLLPGQMIAEHRHVAEGSKFPAKMESWRVVQGWCYNFSIGEETTNAPKLPESQNGNITVKNFVKQMPDEVIHLKELESSHFLMAGDNGAIVTEFATYHDNAGLRFTNPKVVFTDIRTKVE